MYLIFLIGKVHNQMSQTRRRRNPSYYCNSNFTCLNIECALVKHSSVSHVVKQLRKVILKGPPRVSKVDF